MSHAIIFANSARRAHASENCLRCTCRKTFSSLHCRQLSEGKQSRHAACKGTAGKPPTHTDQRFFEQRRSAQVWLVSFIIPVLLLGVFIDAVLIDLDVVITRFTVARPIASFVVFFEEMPLVGSCVVLPVPVVHDTGRTPVVMVTGPVAGTKSPSLLALFAALRTGTAAAAERAHRFRNCKKTTQELCHWILEE